MERQARSFSGDALEHVARSARLSISGDRREVVATTLESIYALIDCLDAVSLGETPPATSAVDPRWDR